MSLAGRWTNEIRGREEGDQSRRRSRRNSDGTRQDAMELFKWNSRNEAAVGSKLGEWVVCTRRYFFCVLRLFLLSHFVSPPSSVVLFYYILYIFIIYYSRNVDFFFYHPLLRTIVFYSSKFSKHRIRFLIASLKFSTLDRLQTGNISIGFRPRDGKALFISARSFPFPEEKKSQGSFREQI